MKDTGDWQLLAQYASKRDQEAFAGLVGKYSDMVFRTALRRTVNQVLAEDVTQAVFIVLSRSAGSLSAKGSLAAWLHKTTLYASNNVLRAESRRRRNERAASRRESIQSFDVNESTNQASVIEEELHRLSNADQELLALHYLESHPMPQVAERLGISLAASRKRLTRALDRLRTRLARRGIVTNAAAIMGTMSGIATAADVQAANAIGSLVVAGGKGGEAFSLASEVLHAMKLLALKKAAAAIAIIGLMASGLGITVAQIASPPKQQSTAGLALQTPQPTSAPAQRAMELPAAIRSALVRNATALNPVTTIEWLTYLTSPLSLEELTRTMKYESDATADHVLNGRRHSRVTWQEGKVFFTSGMEVRKSKYNPSAGELRVLEEFFDGKFLYQGYRPPPPPPPAGRLRAFPTFTRHALTDATLQEGHYFGPAEFLHFTGLHLPLSLTELRTNAPISSRIITLLEQGQNPTNAAEPYPLQLTAVDEIELDGRKLTRLRLVGDNLERRDAEKRDPDAVEQRLLQVSLSSPEHIRRIAQSIRDKQRLPEKRVFFFYLDAQLNYAIRRCEEQYENGILLQRVDCEDFRKLENSDLYIPWKCSISAFTGELIVGTYFKDPIVTTIYQVESVNRNPVLPSTFTWDRLEPGMNLGEMEGGEEKKRLIIQEDGSLLEIQNAVQRRGR